ncbi:hypothetical protein [Candidatus Solirubrobacter pratensis]|uniref:hypothetical protein n=1 Tax=Candidatus Solirubrobacter pratensis TaxID=1298857 RepID=UPI0003F65232|nr:hypothetical protein [Candidatus Solirubrobacter pratensis]
MRIAWGLGAVVFVAGLAAILFVRGGTADLVEGSFASRGDGRWRDGSGAGGEPVRTLLLAYRPGEDASLTLSVRNRGKRAVKLVGAEVLGRGLMFAPRAARFKPTPAEPHAVRPGAAVSLPAGKEAAVELTGRFTGCGDYERGAETSDRTLTVAYESGGEMRTVDVPLRDEIRVISPDPCA